MIKNMRNLFRLNKEMGEKPTKNIKNISRLKNQNKAMDDRILRCIRNL